MQIPYLLKATKLSSAPLCLIIMYSTSSMQAANDVFRSAKSTTSKNTFLGFVGPQLRLELTGFNLRQDLNWDLRLETAETAGLEARLTDLNLGLDLG